MTFEELRKIKGIGPETLKDIQRIYNTVAELRTAIEADKAPLRNDVVKRIKNYFGGN